MIVMSFSSVILNLKPLYSERRLGKRVMMARTRTLASMYFFASKFLLKTPQTRQGRPSIMRSNADPPSGYCSATSYTTPSTSTQLQSSIPASMRSNEGRRGSGSGAVPVRRTVLAMMMGE